jgi:photosystem I subunit 3
MRHNCRRLLQDVPLAWKLLWEGLAWPLRAVYELKTGELLAKDENITVSPR